MYKPKYRHYNTTNTCDNIKEDGKKCENKLYSGNTLREYNKEGNWTGRWICANCWNKNYQKNNPNSWVNIIKSLAKRRTGNLDPDSNQAKGDLFEELTCRWRHVKNLNIESDNYRSPIDHSSDPELGVIQTRGRLYDAYNRFWNNTWKIDHDKKFDHMIFYCVSKDGDTIERIYIFPKNEVLKRDTITIYKNPLIRGGGPWAESYRIKDETVLKLVNEIWKKIINERQRKWKTCYMK